MSIDLNRVLGSEERNAVSLNSHLPWFAVRVKSNYEKPVSAILRGKGIEEFVPTYRSKRYWSDRIKMVDALCSPGICFAGWT